MRVGAAFSVHTLMARQRYCEYADMVQAGSTPADRRKWRVRSARNIKSVRAFPFSNFIARYKSGGGDTLLSNNRDQFPFCMQRKAMRC